MTEVVYSPDDFAEIRSECTDMRSLRAGAFEVPEWLKIAIPCVVSIVGAAVWIATVSIPNSMAAKVDGPIASMQGSLKNVGDQIDAASKRIDGVEKKVDDLFLGAMKKLLKVARVDPPSDAKAKLLVAQDLIQGATREKTPATGEFFQDQIESLNAIAMRPELAAPQRPIRVALADYRSAIAESYIFPKDARKIVEDAKFDIWETPDGWKIWDHSRLPQDSESFVSRHDIDPAHTPKREGPFQVGVQKTVLIGASQTLDAGDWRDVIFYGVRIRYRGGPVVLRRVLFINCTFDFNLGSPKSDRLANYVALNQTEADILP